MRGCLAGDGERARAIDRRGAARHRSTAVVIDRPMTDDDFNDIHKRYDTI